jgi:hypothetical protein
MLFGRKYCAKAHRLLCQVTKPSAFRFYSIDYLSSNSEKLTKKTYSMLTNH